MFPFSGGSSLLEGTPSINGTGLLLRFQHYRFMCQKECPELDLWESGPCEPSSSESNCGVDDGENVGALLNSLTLASF